MFRLKKRLAAALILAMCGVCFSGCQKSSQDTGDKRTIDFTVVEEADVPEEFLKIINDKKAEVFRISYTDSDSLYLARGYGKKDCGGYSIRVTELYHTDNELHFKTELIGPGENEPVTRSETHPYIVIKLENIDKEIIIE